MKKRFVCFLLTLIMLVSLVPVAALTASAASMKTSEAAITVLKKMTQFKDTCYQVANTQEFRIGYGTICEEDGHKVTLTEGKYVSSGERHKILENEADAALRAALADYDKKVNDFASSNGLSLTQNQHDALVVFSYGCGTAWMDGNGVVKTAIVNNAGVNELLNAMNLWTKNADIERRKVEVNMYVNDVYSNVAPSNFEDVTYNANGGTIAQGSPYTMYFDTTKTVSHIPTPTRNGYTFLGWYVSSSGAVLSNDESGTYTASDWTWVPSLNYLCADHTLYALWQPKDLAPDDSDWSKFTAVSYTLSKSSLASTGIYNIPDVKKGEKVGKVETDSVSVIREYIGADGSRWAKIGADQWVIVKAGSNGVPSSGVEIDVTVTVTNSYVNMRKNATIYSTQNGRWNQGDQLRIINTDTADGFLWGQVAKSEEDNTPIGWVALMYTNWNTVKDAANSSDNSTNTTNVIARATITFNGYVNVRSDAGTDNKIVGALAQNETVDVFEIKTVNGHQWGRTTSGWFCMTYAKVTMLVSDSKVSDVGALAYTFTGKTSGGYAHEEPGENTNYVSFVDAKGNTYEGIPTGSTVSVTITNMKVVDGTTWAKATWKNTERDKNNKEITVTRSGWVILTDVTATTYSGSASNTATVTLDPVKFTVISDDVSVRKAPSSSADLVIKLNKGVEIEVTNITLVGENIWGYTASESVDETTGSDTNVNPRVGYVNLASKYVQRTTLPQVEDSDPDMGLMATVINADNVNVRNYGSTTSGKVIGSLARGTTVAVWEANDDKSWYKIDTNKNGVYDYDEDGWVSAKYLELTQASSGNSSAESGDTSATRTTGTGIVANTYAGVNVRSGAGIGNAAVGKLLPGTVVEILETKTVGVSKWGRVEQGWVCMDYITMISYDEIPGGSTTTDPSKGTAVGSLDDVEKTTTTAVYTGKVTSKAKIYKEPNLGSEEVRVLSKDSPITMYELVTVTDIVDTSSTDNNQGGSTTTTTKTSYWARVNEGYIYNPGNALALDGLDEKVHTLTGSDTLNIRDGSTSPISDSAIIGKLEKGDQVKVTKLQIVNDKVWGWAETTDGYQGWIRLDYMSEGAYYVQETPAAAAPTNPAPTIGSTGNTGTGGFVTNSSGYKYTGKVIRNGTTTLKVRATPSPSAKIMTELNTGASLVIYETTIAENMAWGRCDGGWVYLYYVDLTPCSGSAIDAKVVYNENTIAYTDSSCTSVAGTYSRMSVVDIYEVVGKMARTDLGWVNTDNLA